MTGQQAKQVRAADVADITGEFLTIDGERYYAIHNVDRMSPFFLSVVSNSDHWLFVSSAGGLSAGRVSPQSALFPYIPVDRIHEAAPHTGSKTLLRVQADGAAKLWEPFGDLLQSRHSVSRHLYKNLLGNKLRFEEINHSLDLTFRYTWTMSDRYGFVRQAELLNTGGRELHIDVLDGLQNLLPASTPLSVQTNASNLVDAYRWSELDTTTGLALYTLYAGISDRAEPSESLKANTVFSLGLDGGGLLLSSEQLDTFRRGGDPLVEDSKRGLRGAFFACASVQLAAGQSRHWQIVANVEQTQAEVVDLRMALRNPERLAEAVSASVVKDSDELARIMGSADGFQHTAEEMVGAHHYANVLFNTLRGGIFDDQYAISSRDLTATIRHFNRDVFSRNRDFLDGLPEHIDVNDLRSAVRDHGDTQLERLCYEYLPVTFGRRHGDPSRPWNQFAIQLKDNQGNRRLSYQGNWRDIFQNWEALALSYPEFIESIIAKFVNASTLDGYNPYRISSDGIDWEIENPEDPWSTIGYWGDHQIIYLLKLLELSRRFHPTRLSELLHRPIFSYANVPYRIRHLEALLENPKDTVDFDARLAERIAERVERTGADGRLVFDAGNNVCQVTLLEKLLVPLLAKLGNLVPDGGIWLNTQRPEWNDANNALVGNGLSMVTLYYMRRYVQFLLEMLTTESEDVVLSVEVIGWIRNTGKALRQVRPLMTADGLDASSRFETLLALGVASDKYRQAVYDKAGVSGTNTLSLAPVHQLLDDALSVIDESIRCNRRDDGLYHAYNLLEFGPESIHLDTLYPMLEGQVAALSSGAIGPDDACSILESLYESDIYRPDQQSFMLYADRDLPGFLGKNRVAADDVGEIPLLRRMLRDGDERVILQDVLGTYRFNADFRNVGDLEMRLEDVRGLYGRQVDDDREAIIALYERVFNHRAFTGRSGTMFGFEGLGCIYWHMVSKLLLATGEVFQSAVGSGTDDRVLERLGSLYYRIRDGLGFNKPPGDYGAFPMDPYSHTPKHAGARQPGMTGQVKEEIIARFSELGLYVTEGVIRIDPRLLRPREFAANPGTFQYLDVRGDWQELELPANALAFTWCQVPFIYQLDDTSKPSLSVTNRDRRVTHLHEMVLPTDISRNLFARNGRILQVSVVLPSRNLFSG
jgi:hypothetical protein